MKLIDVTCPICGSTDYRHFLTRKDYYLFLPGDFRLVQCTACGLVYLNPRPSADSLDEIYPQEYGPYTIGVREESWLQRRMRTYGLYKRGKAIQRYKKSGRLLDVGCATGDFLFEMQQFLGWELCGVEPSQAASEYARKKLQLSIQKASVEEAIYPDDYFDVITMWNVIEHVPDPTAVLLKIRKWLKPDGILIFNTPNLDSLDARLLGPYWAGFELPRHFLIFSRQTLKTLLTRAGFKMIDSRCFYGSHALFMSGIRFWLRSRLQPPAPRPAIESLLFSLPVRVLFSPLMFLLDRLNLSTAPTSFCVKVQNDEA